jgi:hypothetical protein
MVGTIHADFLDSEEDLITTDRSSVHWNHPSADALEKAIQKRVANICSEWKDQRQSKYLRDDGTPKPVYLGGHTLNELLTEYEGPEVEYKVQVNSGKGFAKEVASLANTKGGVVIIGIDDDKGEAIGVEDPDKKEGQIVGWITNHIEPSLSPEVRIDQYEGQNVIVVEVDRQQDTPCSVNGRFLHKVGSRIKSMSFQDIKDEWIE